MTYRIIVAGAGAVGRALGVRLQTRDDEITLVEQDEQAAATARDLGLPVVVGDATDTDVLTRAGTGGADVLAATTGDDDANLLAAQLATAQFDVERAIARVNDPANAEAFADVGVHPVATSTATAEMIDNYIERPSLTDWIDELSFGGDAQEIGVTNPALDGWTVGDVDELLPEQVVIVLVSHGDSAEFPDPEKTIELGDRVTVLGERSAVREAEMRLVDH